MPALARLLDQIGLGVKPTREQTQCFVEGSKLFNLTALISFDKDELAGSETDEFKSEKVKQNSDVLLFIKQLEARKFPVLKQELEGKHLEPIGIKVGDFIVDLNPLDKFIKALKHRRLEAFAIQFLSELRDRQRLLGKESSPTPVADALSTPKGRR